MAERRMFSAKITESDSFYALPPNAQALYSHLNMLADDDGFVNNVMSAVNQIPGGKAALKRLVESRFLLQFGPIIVVKHWRMANSLKNDRAKKLTYPDIAMQIWMKPNRAYTDHPVDGGKTLYELKTGIQVESKRNPDGIQVDSQPNRTEPNGTEPNGTEPNGTEPNRSGEGGLSEIWNEILRAYPQEKIGNQAAAYDAYSHMVADDGTGRQMADSLRLWMQSEQWSKDGGQYIPYLKNWILNGTWRTKPGKMLVPMGASGQLGEAELEAIQQVLRAPVEDDYGGQDGL